MILTGKCNLGLGKCDFSDNLIPMIKIHIPRKQDKIFHRKISYKQCSSFAQEFMCQSAYSFWFSICLASYRYTDIPSPSSLLQTNLAAFWWQYFKGVTILELWEPETLWKRECSGMPWISQERLSWCIKQVLIVQPHSELLDTEGNLESECCGARLPGTQVTKT